MVEVVIQLACLAHFSKFYFASCVTFLKSLIFQHILRFNFSVFLNPYFTSCVTFLKSLIFQHILRFNFPAHFCAHIFRFNFPLFTKSFPSGCNSIIVNQL